MKGGTLEILLSVQSYVFERFTFCSLLSSDCLLSFSFFVLFLHYLFSFIHEEQIGCVMLKIRIVY